MTTPTTISSDAFSRDIERAKRDALAGPVVITNQGHPTFVLLSHEAYQRLAGGSPGNRQLLDQPGTEDIDLDPPRLGSLLAAASGEQMSRVALAAADVLGNLDAAHEYMHTRNFALGGATPADLLRTIDGEHIVLNELRTQADGGPL